MAEWTVALAAVGAIIGAGFASGREIATFFTMHGRWLWLGAAACCIAAGLLTAMLVTLAKRTQSTSLAQLYTRVMDEKCGEAVQAAHTLLLLIVCAAMCSAAAELGALALSSRWARPAGACCAAALALAGAKSGRRLAGGGLLTAGAIFAFYCILCAQDVPHRPCAQNGAVVSGGLGVLYACLNVALASGVICSAGQKAASPARAGLYTGALLLALLVPACIALRRLGDTDLALPSVALAGELGAFGFWASVAALFAASVSTLATGLFSLRGQLCQAGMPEKWSMTAALGGAALLSAVGFAPIVQVAYPLLGFVCAMLLPVLAIFIKE